MELGSKIAQLYKTISRNLIEEKSPYFMTFSLDYPLYILERIANHLVRNSKIRRYFEQVDFKQIGLDQEILRDIANSIDKDIENLPDAQLRKLCKDLIYLLLNNKSQWSSAWSKGKSNDYNDSLKPDYPLYSFISDIAEITPNQIIYQPHCRLGAMFIKFSNEFSDYNLQFIGQDFHSHGETFTCKINLFANRLENVSSIYLGNPLNILENQVKIKADIAIATNYPLGSLYPTEDYINVSHLETGEKIKSSEVAYIELMLAMTKDDGKVVIVVPDSFLMSHQNNNFLKKYVEKDLIEKIVSIPKHTFKLFDSLPASVIIFNKKKSQNKDLIIFDGEAKKFEKTQIGNNQILSQKKLNLKPFVYASKESKEVESILSTYQQDEIKKIEDLIDASISGFNYSPNNRIVENSAETLPYVRVKDLSNNDKDFALDISKVERKISSEKVTHKRTIIDFSVVLVSKIAPNLKPTLFNFTGQPIVIGSDVVALKVKEDVNVEYFLTQLYSQLVKIQVEMNSSGNTINRISTQDFLNIQIVLPPLEDQERQILEMRGLIAEKKSVEEKIVEAQFEVVASINHSLKNKLAVIINDYDTLVRFLRRKERKSETIIFSDAISANAVGDDIDTIEIITNRLKTNLSDASKVFNNALKIQRQNLKKDVVELVEFFKEEVKPLYAGKNFSIEVNVEPNLKLNVWLDKDAFKDVIENLIENAKSHGFIDDEKNYRIVFDLSKLEDDEDLDGNASTKYARIIYKNDGKPFPQNFSFEDYKQFSNKSGKTQGTGIGGYVINKIIDLHDGRFTFIAPSDDFTVEFEILLPLEN